MMIRTITKRLPEGATVLPAVAPSEPRRVHLVLPVGAGVILREPGKAPHRIGERGLGWVPSRAPVAVCCGRPTDVMWLEISPRLLDRRPALAAQWPDRPSPSSSLVAPVRAFLEAVVTGDSGGRAEPAVDDLLLGMLEALVHEAKEEPAAGSPTAPVTSPPTVRVPARVPLRLQAIAHIAASRDDRSLSPHQIARGLRISVRQLQRAFEEAGSTVVAEIRRQRLEAATALLVDETCDRLSIAEIATLAGFRNDAELRRALASNRGATPTELRSGRS
ncbi:helix-turn-helix domain-containing protein [Herbiconiux sp. P18]|uniref:helix-turn-helix domain-containing protein n=1 Tax=Herbiconiux liangxiaofengii TaxID=3342795 RepID=UPI0035B99D87